MRSNVGKYRMISQELKTTITELISKLCFDCSNWL